MTLPSPNVTRPILWGFACTLLLGSCRSGPGSTADPARTSNGHVGPAVHMAASGPARFVPSAYAAFDRKAAMRTVAFGDGYYRAPASAGYTAVLDHLERELRNSGFGSDPRFQLEELIIDDDYPGWTPLGGKVTMQVNGRDEIMHSFEDESGRDRLMLAMGAPACDVSGEAVFRIRDVRHGTILVTHSPPRADVLRRARLAGAVAVLSSSLASYNVQPGTMKHLEDALHLRRYPASATLPSGQLSRASHARIQAAHDQHGSVTLHFEARTQTTRRPLRMLAATITGWRAPDEAVVMPSHVGYAGASDNASGFGAALTCAKLLADGIASTALDAPDRSIVFLFGPEVDQSKAWLAQTKCTPIAAVTGVGCGDSPRHGGSPQYLERSKDPGALVALAPDAHTQWGMGDLEESDLRPDGLAVVARCALFDLAQAAGPWSTADHPWEGGSDPDAFHAAGVPAILFWHFSSSWYHTSLDRLERIDPAELHRSAIAALSTALALASPAPGDLERYLKSVDIEEELRVQSALRAGNEDLAAQWEDWSAQVRIWFGELCTKP